jgi:hypothetical protein
MLLAILTQRLKKEGQGKRLCIGGGGGEGGMGEESMHRQLTLACGELPTNLNPEP